MKIKSLAIFAAISILSLGAIAACSNPSATTSLTNTSTSTTANPCASKANPCASKTVSQSSSSPLAQQLQGKPVVVDVYASWCPACKNIAPTVSQLKKKYAGKVEFVVLDVSDKSTTTAAEAKAKELGLKEFLSKNKTQTGSLTILDPATGDTLAQYRNNTDIEAYTKVLDAVLAKS